jgi:hypothetical protein
MHIIGGQKLKISQLLVTHKRTVKDRNTSRTGNDQLNSSFQAKGIMVILDALVKFLSNIEPGIIQIRKEESIPLALFLEIEESKQNREEMWKTETGS